MNKTNALLLASTLFSGASFALAQNVADTDGYERSTQYSFGPVSSAAITSEFAHQLRVDLLLRDELSSCQFANVYSNTGGGNNGGEYIVNPSFEIDPATPAKITVSADIPEQYLTNNKTMHVNCIDGEGVDYNVLVNIPGAPIVDWQIDVVPSGEFVHQPYSYGYHSAYSVTSRLTVNNQNNQAYCSTLSNRGVELGLFSGKEAKGPFHSDVFTVNKEVVNDTRQPVLYQILQCENAAGKTLAVKVFSLTNPESIYLLEDQLIIK
ncbi:hypothetical protein PCIT_a0078 [Pseudoalteromonas citrea]|uniref:Uncharacterized protein n=2 Tax=Pseudoalteromonas citrea TaxID=43655 RepID=A0AAD4AK27_9GAMM|nr:hypothetical protein [Pseudoalteromonas citrea]KAF7773762.1 hypothetical protein PCIT_a0078 [Pseudoalteromonas citrea]